MYTILEAVIGLLYHPYTLNFQEPFTITSTSRRNNISFPFLLSQTAIFLSNINNPVYNENMSLTLSLYRLQQIDSQIDRIQNRLNKLDDLLNDDTELMELKRSVESAENKRLSAEQSLKRAEEAAHNQSIKIEQMHSALYGTKSHSPKELQDLQNDVASLKRHLVVLEDHQIETMIASETADSDLLSAENNLQLAQNARASQNNDLLSERQTLANDLDRLLIERNAVSVTIIPSELMRYDQLRLQRRGVAVAIIGDNSCGACGSTLNLAQIQSARSAAQVTLCPSCGRILYGS